MSSAKTTSAGREYWRIMGAIRGVKLNQLNFCSCAGGCQIEGSCSLRNRVTVLATFFAASSISAAVVVCPKLKRNAVTNRSSATFIAFRTGEGNSEPLEQAEPVEQQT